MMSPAQSWTPGADQVLVAGIPVGHQAAGEARGDAAADAALAPRAQGPQERQPPVRGGDDQHVRGPAGLLRVLLLPCLRFRVRLAAVFGFRTRERGLVQDGHRRLARGQDGLGGQRRAHGLVEPALAVLAPLPLGLLPALFSRALRAAFAPMPSFDGGVPESLLSIDRRRSSSATRSSSHEPQACST